MGFPEFFANALAIFILLLAWVLVVLAFFVMSIQMLVTVLEFKLTSLAGFTLVPFAFWNKSSFLAERVLGNVISSGVKVMVLALIVGIGASFFDTFLSTLGTDPDLAAAMTLMLSALTLAGLSIFGPGIAAGLVSGAPQLGAGAAVGASGGRGRARRRRGAARGQGARHGRGRRDRGGSRRRVDGRAGASAALSAAPGDLRAPPAWRASPPASAASLAPPAGRRSTGCAICRPRRRDAEGRRPGRPGGGLESHGREPGVRQPRRRLARRRSGGTVGPERGPAQWARDLKTKARPASATTPPFRPLKDGDRPGASANPDLKQED